MGKSVTDLSVASGVEELGVARRLDYEKARRYRPPIKVQPPVSSNTYPPTEPQLRYIASLAEQAHQPVPEITCRVQASQQISRLKYLAAHPS